MAVADLLGVLADDDDGFLVVLFEVEVTPTGLSRSESSCVGMGLIVPPPSPPGFLNQPVTPGRGPAGAEGGALLTPLVLSTPTVLPVTAVLPSPGIRQDGPLPAVVEGFLEDGGGVKPIISFSESVVRCSDPKGFCEVGSNGSFLSEVEDLLLVLEDLDLKAESWSAGELGKDGKSGNDEVDPMPMPMPMPIPGKPEEEEPDFDFDFLGFLVCL